MKNFDKLYEGVMNKVSYTALVLDKESRQRILGLWEIPEGWEKIGHHMTINMGASKYPELVGVEGSAKAVSIAIDHELGVMAIGVESDTPSDNKIKHITLAVNRSVGAKPFMSNKLKEWNPLPSSTNINFTGTIIEVPN